MVRNPVLLAEPDLHQDLHPTAVQTDIYLPGLGEEGHPRRALRCPSHRSLACRFRMHGLHPPRGFLEVVAGIRTAGLLPAAEPLVGECGSAHHHRCCYRLTADAGHLDPSIASQAEDGGHGGICAGLLVSVAPIAALCG